MKSVKGLMFSIVLALIFLATPVYSATQVGGGYGRQLLKNTDIEQYEILVRQSLPYETKLGDKLPVSTDMEMSAAIIRERSVGDSEVGRFFFMPQLVLSPNDRTHLFVGVGAGFMVGETNFTKHDLGGALFLASKLGMRFSLWEGWGVESAYYHQSNAGIYDHNASLNMLQLAIIYSF